MFGDPVRPGSFQQLFGRYVQPETGVRVEYDCIGIGDGCLYGRFVKLANPCFAYLAGRSVRDCFDVYGQYVGYRRGFQSSAGQGEPGFYLVGHCGDVSGYPYRFDECAASRL